MKQLLPQRTHTTGETNGIVFIIDGRLYELNEYERLIPLEDVPSNHVGWMYDGVTADIDGTTYKVHTRAESSEEYEVLSR